MKVEAFTVREVPIGLGNKYCWNVVIFLPGAFLRLNGRSTKQSAIERARRVAKSLGLKLPKCDVLPSHREKP